MKQNWNERRDKTNRRHKIDRRDGVDRRSGMDQRNKELPVEINNRNGLDRRKGQARRKGSDPRGGLDRRLLVPSNNKKVGKIIVGGVVLATLALSLFYYEKNMSTENLSGTIAGMETQQIKIRQYHTEEVRSQNSRLLDPPLSQPHSP